MIFKYLKFNFSPAIFPLILLPIFFNSCIGVSADITLNQNGSGVIILEYQISKALDSLGKLDGNERWNTIPVGRADFERTLDRLPGIKMLSFSSIEKENEKNLQVTVKMEFLNPQALMAFLDSAGLRSSFSGDAHSGSLSFTLSNNGGIKNLSLDSLLAGVFEGYNVGLSFTFPGEGNLKILNSEGLPAKEIPKARIIPNGKKVSFSLPLYELLACNEGIKTEVYW
jgi:hypothetical protein